MIPFICSSAITKSIHDDRAIVVVITMGGKKVYCLEEGRKEPAKVLEMFYIFM